MELGMIGLGRTGANMTERLVRGGHRVVGFDLKAESRMGVEATGAESAPSLGELVAKLKTPRTLWLMIPAGNVTDGTVTTPLPLLSAGDTIASAAIRTTRTRCAAPRCSPPDSCTTSIAVPAAASGGLRRATA